MKGNTVTYIGNIHALRGETGFIIDHKISNEMFGVKMEYDKCKVRWDNHDLGDSGYLPVYEFTIN